jgi:four helix bundle protein
LDISRSSLAEAQTQIYIGIKIKYIDKNTGNLWIKELEEIGKMLTALINNINNKNQP